MANVKLKYLCIEIDLSTITILWFFFSFLQLYNLEFQTLCIFIKKDIDIYSINFYMIIVHNNTIILVSFNNPKYNKFYF